ncbi:MAG: pyruvate kinase [Bacilli bacterium]|nr:pyruvate kinase [Bacilli bacterium]
MDIKRTKIIASIGPATENVEILTSLVNEGMDVVRVNFSHGTYEEYDKVVELVEKVREKSKKQIGILFDTKGPDFRLLDVENGCINLVEGENIRIVKKGSIGTKNGLLVNHNEVIKNIKVDDTVLINDGLIVLKVVSVEKDGITCKVISGGEVSSHKGVSVPGRDLHLPFMSENDFNDITYACSKNGDFIALSFVSSKEDILKVREVLDNNNSTMQIISKIENETALENIDEIIDSSDGIMVARGDLGVEIPVERLPIIQKMLVQKCREKGKICIVATEMLASMEKAPRPTRAEVTDVANAVLDGCDAVMLSAETTVGLHPVEAVSYMSRICREAENNYDYDYYFEYEHDKAITAAVAKAVVASITEVDAKAVVVPTMGGHSARVMSNLKPKPIIVAPTPTEDVARKLSLAFGVIPVVVPVVDDFNELTEISRKTSQKILDLEKGDVIIITGGIHRRGKPNETNFIKIEEI